MLLLATLSFLAVLSSPQSATVGAPLKPAGSWVVDYADNACNVVRTFGTGDQRVSFALILMPGRATSQIVINRPYDGRESVRQGDLVITTDSGSTAITVPAMSGSVEAGSRLLRATITDDDLIQIERAKSLVFKHRGQVMHLATNGLKVPLAAALTCEDDLLRSWGTDPVAFRSIATRAKPLGPVNWVTNDDYPEASLRMHESGVVGVRLDIAADGKLSGCTVISSSKSPRLDAVTCDLMRRRARYEPARLADGTTTPSMSFLRFRWQVFDF